MYAWRYLEYVCPKRDKYFLMQLLLFLYKKDMKHLSVNGLLIWIFIYFAWYSPKKYCI